MARYPVRMANQEVLIHIANVHIMLLIPKGTGWPSRRGALLHPLEEVPLCQHGS